MLEEVTLKFASITEELWYKYSKYGNITKYSKAQWNEEYNRNLTIYQTFRSRTNQIRYRKIAKIAKQIFFNNKIQEVILTNKRL